jgi:hypothetical protein
LIGVHGNAVEKMDSNTLIAKYPRLFHMAEDGSWPSIKRYGLLSTSALLTLYNYTSNSRELIESKWRSSKITISCEGLDDAVIRDQIPMPPERLRECLPVSMPVNEWYQCINERVFFWVTWQNLKWFLAAKAYIRRPHLVLFVDTSRLLRQYQNQVSLSDINTGSTYPKKGQDHPEVRSRETFKRISDYHYPFVTELTVDHGVNNICDFMLSAGRYIAHQKDEEPEKLKHIWP